MLPRKLSPACAALQEEESDTGPFYDDIQRNMQQLRDPRRGKLQVVRNAAFTLTALLCLWIVLVTAWRTTLHPTPRALKYKKERLTCGNSTAEAESLGCVFDLLSHNWLPVPCMDYEITAEFRQYVLSADRHLGAWPYFIDANEERIKDETSLAHIGGQRVATTQEEYLAHCDFLIRRMHRAASGITKLDGSIARYSHTLHCIHELKNPKAKPLDVLNKAFHVGFSDCHVDVVV